MKEQELAIGTRIGWRNYKGTVVDDYWRHRDRFTVRFDGDDFTLDFGAGSLRPIPQEQSA